MSDKIPYENLMERINPKKSGDHAWFLSLLDEETQKRYEDEHMAAVMQMLRIVRIRAHKRAIVLAKAEIKRLEQEENSAENYKAIRELLAEIKKQEEKIEQYHPFFDEPYFARMDLIDNVEGYNSYYIGKKGDVKLEIVDWRAPIARRYYQKSCSSFKINEYEFKTILRRAIRAAKGQVLAFKDEYLSLRDYLSAEEIKDRDEDNILDPFLKEIIKNRKDEPSVKDIIETIQELQYEMITLPEKTNFVLQGCAGSGKTMVMLHRLSYLMYNNEDIKPRDVLVITPSQSYNAFIDELAQILDLERVKTLTVQEYFLQVLKNEKIDIAHKIDETQTEIKEYLQYVYSPKFVADIEKKMGKAYNDLYGLFIGEECKEFIDTILRNCNAQILAYEGIKNASMRVRRAVLGEMKERKEGGLYYTRPFRYLMNAILDIQDFLGGTLTSERAKSPDYFYRQLMSFYKSGYLAVNKTEAVTQEALNDLAQLKTSLEQEIRDLKRFKQKVGDVDVYLYADRIARRTEIVEEIDKVTKKVEIIAEGITAFAEFFTFLRGEKEFVLIGGSDAFIDVVRYFYRETVKKYKLAYGMNSNKLYKSDAYALCVICAQIAQRLTPAYAYVFVDEAQDISSCEYDLIRTINQKASFNVFGDVAQNVTAWRGIESWENAFPDFSVYSLTQNYRNTNQIVDFVSNRLGVNMQSVGYDGPQVERITPRQLTAFFKEKKGLKAIICADAKKAEILKKSYHDVSVKKVVSRSKINVMNVYESKGLEFSSVVVVEEGLSNAELYIAYTRALKTLAVIE